MKRFFAAVAAIALLYGVGGCSYTGERVVADGDAVPGALVGQATVHGWCVYENAGGYRYTALCPPR
jgi:hypothetical protein